jgi:hypothetical protein
MAYYNVKLFAQSYDYGCWLASTHMLNYYNTFHGLDNSYSAFTESVSLYDSRGIVFYDSWLGEHWGLLLSRSVLDAYCEANGLYMKAFDGSMAQFQSQIEHGPFMVVGTIAGVGDHFYVISKVSGKNIQILDPMPIGRGKIVNTTIDALKATNPSAFQWCFWKM